jgi:hypothetical protein
VLNAAQLEAWIKSRTTLKTASNFLFVNRFLVKKNTPWVEDSNKLRISRYAFRFLRTHFEMAPSFVATLANLHQPSVTGGLQRSRPNSRSFNFWYLIPVRVQVQCSDRANKHIVTHTGKSQMNPLNYLHLPQPQVDIRGSKIAVYSLYEQRTQSSTTIVFNFQDGRWSKIVEEPVNRVKEVFSDIEKTTSNPFLVHTVYLSSALRLWTNALNSFNDQLIAYEEELLSEEKQPPEESSKLNSELSRRLHCMASHLHRYGSEIASLQETINDVRKQGTEFHQISVTLPPCTLGMSKEMSGGFEQLSSQAASIKRFRDELQLKTDNVLALQVDYTQVANDRLLVQNSKAMHLILQTTQTELTLSRRMALQSRQLAEEMKKDSVSMKTIALLTVFFLPGTSFAAILAMPFFSTNRWTNDTGKIWIWIVLTVPSTVVAFLFYILWKRREDGRRPAFEDEEMTDLGCDVT